MPYLADLLQIRPTFTDVIGRTHEIVTWWLGTGSGAWPLTADTLTAIQAEWDPSFNENIWQQYGATTATYKGAQVTDWSGADGLTAPPDIAGVDGTKGNELPAQVAILNSYASPIRYKGGHGRSYFPCVGIEVQNDGMTITDACQIAMQGGWVTLQALMLSLSGTLGGPYSQVVFHQKPKVGDPFVSLIPSFKMNIEWATQRRRQRKVAHH